MSEIPQCLNRRYEILDELIKDLNARSGSNDSLYQISGCASTDTAVRLMCNFWDIIKENPDCDISSIIRRRMGLNPKLSVVFKPQTIQCFMAGGCCSKDQKDDDKDKKRSNMEGKNSREIFDKVKSVCCDEQADQKKDPKSRCCSSKAMSQSLGNDALPLSKVLCNLKDAASFDQKCNVKLNELLETEKRLQDQITHLEHREKEGIALLKQADCMWTCMEEAYKKKIAESLEKQKGLMSEFKEIDTSASKWRKNKKDLEIQITSINKGYQEIKDAIHQKTNELKCVNTEINALKKRIDIIKKDSVSTKKSFDSKKKASNQRISNISKQVTQLEKEIKEEKKNKCAKDKENSKMLKEAREDLAKICRGLLQKKLENEDNVAERDALNFELDTLKDAMDTCKDKCKNKQISLIDELKKINKEIAEYKVKCIQCHQCISTVDIRKFCIDCPRCAHERDCLYEKGQCRPDHTLDCICMSVKEKFLDNVFENMYTVLERKIQTPPGKAVADAVLKCLKKSKNGKLNNETRRILQTFILTTIKKNLTLTIIGGAVKTRCELDPESYKQLMLCLKQVKVVPIPKADKGTNAKKEACVRWGGANECNCPRGPKNCICSRKGPKRSKEPPSSPPTPPEKEDADESKVCPHRENPCGPDCAMHALPENAEPGADDTQWVQSPCQGQNCTFSKNMRAAQCVLGAESLVTGKGTPNYMSSDEFDPILWDSDSDNELECTCEKGRNSLCPRHRDRISHPRDKIISEVMGRYNEYPTTIEKVNPEILSYDSIDMNK